jgi:hypothetical protein
VLNFFLHTWCDKVYAPTFRADGSLEPYSLDIQRVIAAEQYAGWNLDHL